MFVIDGGGGLEINNRGENVVLRKENFRPNRLRKLFTSNQNQKTKTLQTQHTQLNFITQQIYTRKENRKQTT